MEVSGSIDNQENVKTRLTESDFSLLIHHVMDSGKSGEEIDRMISIAGIGLNVEENDLSHWGLYRNRLAR